jgi:hypothetical protein
MCVLGWLLIFGGCAWGFGYCVACGWQYSAESWAVLVAVIGAGGVIAAREFE